MFAATSHVLEFSRLVTNSNVHGFFVCLSFVLSFPGMDDRTSSGWTDSGSFHCFLLNFGKQVIEMKQFGIHEIP